ncbi:MAG: glucosaminidase domain-containing protein [Bacteroidetes bacterium]|nr:glucosaminidase domain-containing protein [Bacteroidota bacterium]
MMCQFVYGQNEVDVLNYIDKYKGFAIEEQQRTGVPAAITLAQGIHETAAGNSELATQANNHFGIKCKANWTGETFLHDDDKKQECFRKYVNAQQSYIDHSDFLRAGSRYQFLFELEITDYVSWASGLKKAGYATNPAYVKKLTDLVEKYNLQQYTYDALSQVAKKPGELIPNIDAKNPDIIEDPTSNYKGLKGFWAKKGDRLQDKATQLDIKYQNFWR